MVTWSIQRNFKIFSFFSKINIFISNPEWFYAHLISFSGFKPYQMHFINNNYFIWTIDLCSIYAPFWIILRMPSIDTLLLWLSFLLQISDPLKFLVCYVVYVLNLVLSKYHYSLMNIYRSKTNMSLCLRLIHRLFLFILCILKIWI